MTLAEKGAAAHLSSQTREKRQTTIAVKGAVTIPGQWTCLVGDRPFFQSG